MLTTDDSATNRGARECRNADANEDKRHSGAISSGIVSGKAPDSRVVQALDGASEEAIEASEDREGGVTRGGDPGKEQDGCYEDARGEGVDWAEEAVG